MAEHRDDGDESYVTRVGSVGASRRLPATGVDNQAFDMTDGVGYNSILYLPHYLNST